MHGIQPLHREPHHFLLFRIAGGVRPLDHHGIGCIGRVQPSHTQEVDELAVVEAGASEEIRHGELCRDRRGLEAPVGDLPRGDRFVCGP